ncbi:MAG: hypothetical protein BWX78_00313 [Firmicutes bacterium ADurb.Bin099]|nr:MAG: hypothetical protein BWX78_00313 [Firmicutes bacterium ADurb.Bin099]
MDTKEHTKNILPDMRTLSVEQMNTELEKGYADILEGRTKQASKVFTDIRKAYNL